MSFTNKPQKSRIPNLLRPSILILSASLITMACDKSKDDLNAAKADNATLSQQIQDAESKAQANEKAAQKLEAENKALNKKIEEYKVSEKTLADLKSAIKENTELKEKLGQQIESAELQYQQAFIDLKAAEATYSETLKESDLMRSKILSEAGQNAKEIISQSEQAAASKFNEASAKADKLKADAQKSAETTKSNADKAAKKMEADAEKAAKKRIADADKAADQTKKDADGYAESKKSEAADLLEKAEMKRLEAEKMRATAKKVLETVITERSKLKTLSEKLASKQLKLNAAVEHWKGIYADAKLDTVFSKLMSQKKMEKLFPFQFSVVAINATPEGIAQIRKDVQKIVMNQEGNLYKKAFQLKPSQELVEKRVRNNANGKVVRKIYIVSKAPDFSVMNDSYVATTTGDALLRLRRTLERTIGAKKGSAVFVVPRLIEKIGASVSLEVYRDKQPALLEDRKIGLAGSINLVENKEVKVNLAAVNKIKVAPIASIFKIENCTNNFDDRCIAELKKKGLLEGNIAVDGQQTPVRKILAELAKGSELQVEKDLSYLDEKIDTSNALVKALAKWVNNRRSEACLNQELVLAECDEEPAKDGAPVDHVGLAGIHLKSNFHMIYDMPTASQVPIDLVFGSSDLRALSVSIKDQKITQSLPLMSSHLVKYVPMSISKKNVEAEESGKKFSPKSFARKQLLEISALMKNLQKALK